jgi:regulator of sigma E protease
MTIVAMPTIALVDLAPFGKRRVGRLGIRASSNPADRRLETCALPECFVWSVKDTWSVVSATGSYLGGLFAGRESADQISGPIGVAQVAGEVAKISLLALFSLTAVFSVSVGLMNLLPVPMLDGGHLLFYAIEAVRGRPLSERTQEIGLRVGIALVAMLVIFSTSHDILRLVGGGG